MGARSSHVLDDVQGEFYSFDDRKVLVGQENTHDGIEIPRSER